MSQITQEVQKLDPSAIVSLFTLDATSLGGPVMRFTQSSKSYGPVLFQTYSYDPADVEFDGLETSGVGAFPTPKVKLANTNGAVQALVNTYGDLNGCTLSRIRTFARFLDGEPEADSTAFFGPDTYRVERKLDDNPEFIQWELSTSIDQEGKMIPGRVIVKNTCMWRYRVWDATANGGAGAFDYSKAQCPYAGAQAYDINDQPVADAFDFPSRTLNCCKARFGEDQPLPFGGFPGVPKS
ncbi:phage minor tail protein L [Phaeobacter gallaeciensis]|uniref:phage minor tail protein L n=1 Tax=Phaeobacter gallaeciensis TaxID=60890 RepID=UPI00238018BC|nr:phage minor tail protein L [Phaeobacter gallaeciensis]MDE4297082.1 phage minor tail protein L [Phaeobacter gallaeciensis]